MKDIRNYIKRGKLWDAFVADERPVLLIDEIDKADIEFPNDLLLELDRMEFFVYETSETVKARRRPIVVITSNNEKELPDAFLRRCFFHYIRFPDADTMTAIIEVHFPGIKQRLVAEALKLFYEIRDVPGLKKKPSTSELLDWLKLLMVEDIGPETLRERDPKKLIPPLHGALLKNEQDVHLFERLAFMATARRALSLLLVLIRHVGVGWLFVFGCLRARRHGRGLFRRRLSCWRRFLRWARIRDAHALLGSRRRRGLGDLRRRQPVVLLGVGDHLVGDGATERARLRLDVGRQPLRQCVFHGERCGDRLVACGDHLRVAGRKLAAGWDVGGKGHDLLAPRGRHARYRHVGDHIAAPWAEADLIERLAFRRAQPPADQNRVVAEAEALLVTRARLKARRMQIGNRGGHDLVIDAGERALAALQDRIIALALQPGVEAVVGC